MQKSLKPFYDSLGEINLINSNLEEIRESLRSETEYFYKSVQSLKTTSSKQNPELSKLHETTISTLKLSAEKWKSKFDDLLEKERFREELKNHFIVIVFGKVKAGKSTLGNFIAENNSTDSKVSFFKYDKAGKKESLARLEELSEDIGFATNNLECTIEIQGFKLGDLAWIDTPGLGSMTPENGELAKEYIQSADYIIYPTSSDSPLQADEIKSIKELFSQNKRVSILITKSDEKDEDEVDGKMVSVHQNKSKEEQKKQENYVRTEVQNILKEKDSLIGDIFSISVITAKDGLKNGDIELFENSNIPTLYKTLTDVVKTKASKLKEEAPINRLRSFVQNDVSKLIESEIGDSFDKLDKKIQDVAQTLETMIANIKSDISLKIEQTLSKYTSKIDKHNYKEIFAQIDKEISDKIEEFVNIEIDKLFKGFTVALKEFQTSNLDSFEIRDKIEDVSYTVKYETSGFLRKVVNAVTLGLVERTYSTKTYTDRVVVGDNKRETIETFKISLIENHTNSVETTYKKLENSFFKPLQKSSSEMKDILNGFKNKLEKVVKNV